MVVRCGHQKLTYKDSERWKMKRLRCVALDECRELHKKKNQRKLVKNSAEKEKKEEWKKK